MATVSPSGTTVARPSRNRTSSSLTKLLGLNAIDCYGLDEAGLRQVADRVGPTPEQLGQDPGLRTAEGATRTARWWLDEYGCEMQYA